MHLHLVCVGHNQPRWVVEGTEEYAKRFSRTWRFSMSELKPERRGDGRAIAPLLAAEAERITAQVPRDAALVALDERGDMVNSRGLAAKLTELARAHSSACFVIGSADGLDPSIRSAANWRWSLSALTLPHGLARVLAVEQLYRAVSLVEGMPYHRD